LPFLVVVSLGGTAAGMGGTWTRGGPERLPGGDSAKARGDPDGTPTQATAAEQLVHAASLKTAIRGTTGKARDAARRAAIEAYRAVCLRFQNDGKACAEASFRAGELLRAAGDGPAAIAEFERARERGAETPFRVRAMLEIGHVLRREGKSAEALGAYETAVAEPRATPSQRDDASYWIGRVHLADGRVTDARRSWERVALRAEDPLARIRAWDAIALTFVASGDLEGAAGVIERCREALSEHADEETKLGERVRDALSTMRVLDDLQRAVRDREERRSRSDDGTTDLEREHGAKKKLGGSSVAPRTSGRE
jgi:tetratricopeptide (TPR) repeat protein